MGRGNRKDSRKCAFSEDDELDPMDPSSYSDAPRGGWYIIILFIVFFFSLCSGIVLELSSLIL